MTVTAAQGFVAAGVASGVKDGGGRDLALVATEDRTPVAAAGVFTRNEMTAAPVQVSRAHLEATGGHATAVVLNSGNANAATGAPGLEAAGRMCAEVSAELQVDPEQVLVCSTGLIGIPLPVGTVCSAVPAAVSALASGGGGDAARAILTTDTLAKEVVVPGPGFVVGGMAKGAAMLAPNMATMLAVLTTDAQATPAQLHDALTAGVDDTFNALVVDGATSTNDTVLLLASGQAGPVDPAGLATAVHGACADLARQMADDAEGSTKTVTVSVTGAADDAAARTAARAVAYSQLTKCSWYGEDPYWGRVASDLGSCGVAFDQSQLRLDYGGVTVASGGVATEHDVEAVVAHMSGRDLDLVADLGLGRGQASVLTTDLTHAYVDENMGTS